MSDHPELKFSFTTLIRFDDEVADGYMKHFVPVPAAVADALEAAGVQHVEGTLAGQPFRRVLHVRSDGERCLRFGRTWLDQAGLDVGDAVEMTLVPDPDPDRVDMPDELAAALRADPAAEHAWSFLPPGRRKMLAYHVERAKRTETRKRRAQTVIDEVRQTM